jgi:hypothetical protein
VRLMKLQRLKRNSKLLTGKTTKKVTAIDSSSATLSVASNDEDIAQIRHKKRKRNPRYVGDIYSDEFNTPRRGKRNWHIAKRSVAIKRKKLVALQQRNRRLKARILCLKSLLKHLHESNYISENAKIAVGVSYKILI